MKTEPGEKLVFMIGVDIATPGRSGDLLAQFKSKPNGTIEGEYRFRWHNSPGFDVKDDMSRYLLPEVPDTPETRSKWVASLRTLCEGAGKFTRLVGGAGEVKEYMFKTGEPGEMIDALESMGWKYNRRVLSPEEFKKEYGGDDQA